MESLDSLSAIVVRPVLVERAVGSALVEAMKWRLGGGPAPTRVAFVCAAVAAVRASAGRAGIGGGGCLRLAAATERAATRFVSSPLGERLLTLPGHRIAFTRGTRDGADVIVRDERHQLHLIALTMLRRPLEIADLAGRIAQETPIAARDSLAPLRVHVFSLASGNRHEYRYRAGPASAARRRSA